MAIYKRKKWLKIINRPFGLNKYMNWSKFHSTKANLIHLAAWILLVVSVIRFHLAKKVFQPYCRYKPLKKFAVVMKASRLILNFAARQRENRAKSWMVSSCDWLTSLLSRFWLIYDSGLKYIFSPLNSPFSPAKYTAMPNEVIIMGVFTLEDGQIVWDRQVRTSVKTGRIQVWTNKSSEFVRPFGRLVRRFFEDDFPDKSSKTNYSTKGGCDLQRECCFVGNQKGGGGLEGNQAGGSLYWFQALCVQNLLSVRL